MKTLEARNPALHRMIQEDKALLRSLPPEKRAVAIKQMREMFDAAIAKKQRGKMPAG